jgi:hypothetical protein
MVERERERDRGQNRNSNAGYEEATWSGGVVGRD